MSTERVLAGSYDYYAPESIRQGWRGTLCHTHTYSERETGTLGAWGYLKDIADWCRAHGVRAVALGSPYSPENGVLYHQHNQVEWKRYYSGEIDPDTLLQPEHLREMVRQANLAARGEVLFYLDNETPKARYGHMWWVGYHEQFPAWHDYDVPFDLWMASPDAAGDGEEPIPNERRPYMQLVAQQRRFGALGFWAHPTSWWFHGEEPTRRFITNIATEMPAHLFADGYVDGMVVMGYDAWRPGYVELWQAMLDMGYRVPAVAEMDANLCKALYSPPRSLLLNYLNPAAWDDASLARAFADGHLYASSGPHLHLSVDGVSMGQIAQTAAGLRHSVQIDAAPAPGQTELGCIELVGPGGNVFWRKTSAKPGKYAFELAGLSARGYCYARAFGQGIPSAPHDKLVTADVAITNPVYLHTTKQGFETPLQTKLCLNWRPDSPWLGGTLATETADGQEVLDSARITAESYRCTIPASTRLHFRAADGREKIEYLINANAPLQEMMRYLYRGRFLRDFNAMGGEVPLAAWKLEQYRETMKSVTLAR